ncbi:hypothetical protein SAMN05428963_11441 [Consotaella salsifontis]|uniref:Uncharacterized protein n=1 Tax=Consotaella salsifontis TaxID=1365950 RepID=A0A1T4SU05_9HYPH|nr:hypothetical protein SAMN05428963_11441 [Consotaella salsifontis]
MDHFDALEAEANERNTCDYRTQFMPFEVQRELTALVDKTIADIVAGVPAPDAILGDYVGLASLIRSLSFHEGRLLEQAMVALCQRNTDLVVLSQSLRLPVTSTALEAIANNRTGTLKGLAFDADVKTRMTYTPDLIVVNRRRHSATVIDMKRSVASYLDTNRLEELKRRMLAVSLILPDWLYKEHKRLMVDEVGIAIVDGASAPSDHDAGIWALEEIDDLLEMHGAATAMKAMRLTFGDRVRELLKAEAERVVGRPAKRFDTAFDKSHSHFRCELVQDNVNYGVEAENISAGWPGARMIRVGVARTCASA